MFILLVLFAAESGHAQIRKKRTPKTPSTFKVQHFVGPIAQFNNISGIEWEMTMPNRSGNKTKSTFSLIGGYSSRYGKTDYVKPFNDTIELKKNKTQWVHGLGAAVVLNNFIKNNKEGFYWSVGASGNYYFKKGIATQLVGAEGIAYKKSKELKTFSVFLITGYKHNLNDRYSIKPSLGAGLMGSPFRSSSSSALNGFFVNAGCSFLYEWK